jgi:hypothetical protein
MVRYTLLVLTTLATAGTAVMAFQPADIGSAQTTNITVIEKTAVLSLKTDLPENVIKGDLPAMPQG